MSRTLQHKDSSVIEDVSLIFMGGTHFIDICFRKVIDGVARVAYVAGPMLFFDLVMVSHSTYSGHVQVTKNSI